MVYQLHLVLVFISYNLALNCSTN